MRVVDQLVKYHSAQSHCRLRFVPDTWFRDAFKHDVVCSYLQNVLVAFLGT